MAVYARYVQQKIGEKGTIKINKKIEKRLMVIDNQD